MQLPWKQKHSTTAASSWSVLLGDIAGHTPPPALVPDFEALPGWPQITHTRLWPHCKEALLMGFEYWKKNRVMLVSATHALHSLLA